MNLVQETVSVPKEAKDVKDLLVLLCQDIKAKKSTAEIAADALPKLMAAIDGFDKLGEEAKDASMPVLAGLMAGQVAAVFLAK